MGEHRTGGYCDVTSRRPVTFAWTETFGTREEALSAELVVKKWSPARKKALMSGDWVGLSYFAKPSSERITASPQANGNAEPEGLTP